MGADLGVIGYSSPVKEVLLQSLSKDAEGRARMMAEKLEEGLIDERLRIAAERNSSL